MAMHSSSSARRIALFGNVNTEEIMARHLVQEGAVVDGYLRFPNEAFARACRKTRMLNDEYVQTQLVEDLQTERYDVVHLGPDFIVPVVSDILRAAGIKHIGATPGQLAYETDKRLIHEVFPDETGILSPSLILTKGTDEELKVAIEMVGPRFVLKFVGDYSQKYTGSPVGRVRFSGETIGDFPEILEFVTNSIEVSGGCVIEKLLIGKEFSANYALDAAGNFFRFGENICYKRRNNGNAGPMCDGCGSVTVGNTLPFLDERDIAFIEERIVRPFAQHVKERTGIPLCALINVDLMKTDEGKIVLFEVNCREAGGHTMATILPLLQNSLSEVLVHTQEGTLSEIAPSYASGVTVIVSAFPSYFPGGVSSEEELMVLEIPKMSQTDVALYTGWVDVCAETDTSRTLRLRNSPVLLFACVAPTLDSARAQIYPVIDRIVQGRLDYRTDIGLNVQ